MKHRTLHSHDGHYGWDRSLPPKLSIAPGESVELAVQDASSGQLHERSTAADVAAMDPERVNPVLGPIRVDGAEPGDAIGIELLEFGLGTWGWSAIIPGFGLLTRDFPDPFFHVSRYDAEHVAFTPEVRVPLRPFAGTIGLAPAAAGRHSVIPPRRVGGNLDCRDLVAGAKLWLPVEVPGGLLSIGDTHAAQGDGEVCGTAIETSLVVRARIDLRKDARLRFPRAELPADPRPTPPRASALGVGPDLMQACRDALRETIDHLVAEYGLSPELAYCLCSAAVDLRVSEVVDAPNWVVSAQLPLDIFV